MPPLRAVICDFGGVLTTPLLDSFASFRERSGVAPEDLGRAMAAVAARDGAHPLFELEVGRMTEADFLAKVQAEVERERGEEVAMGRFTEVYFEALRPNEAMVELMRELRDEGYRMALLTNNVREWESRWRALLPIDEIFELVIDSSSVGMRKPDPEIYELTLERLGDGISAAECLFIDDIPGNVDAARELGMSAVQFRDNDETLPEIRSLLQS